jgi:hypothetical protein
MTVFEFCKNYGVEVGDSVWPTLLANFPTEIRLPESVRLSNDKIKVYGEAVRWATESFTDLMYVSAAYRFFFKEDRDAMQFKLAWTLS